MSNGKRNLSHEDRIIWAQVARTVDPLPGRKIEDEEWYSVADTPAAARSGAHPPATQPQPPRKPEGSPGPRLHAIEQPVIRKLARGRLPIDGRIDLHGMTQSEAHNLLFGFLARAHERGLRHVLVITGKGASRGSDGALKRLVPQWLTKPEFRFLVSGHEEAARSHGGEGALYIRLRRERGKP